MATDAKHPADEIAQALSRASGILTVISECYDKAGDEFAIGTGYVAQSIGAVDNLLASATDALARLYQTCDLTVVREVPASAADDKPVAVAATEAPVAAPAAEPQTITLGSVFGRPAVKPAKTGYLAAFGPAEPAGNLAERIENATPTFKPTAATMRDAVLDQPATTYEELLAKVTAVADQAAFQSHGTPNDRSLAPVLESLRADIMKMRSVA